MGWLRQVLRSGGRAYQSRRAAIRAQRERGRRAEHPAAAEGWREEPPERPADPGQSSPTPPAPAAPPSVDELVPRSLRVAAAWSWRLIVVAIVTWALLALVDRFLILVAPLMIGLLLAGLLAPALRWVLRLRLNRSLATLLVLVLGLGVVGGTLTLVINQFIAGSDRMVRSAEDGIADIQNWLQGPPLNMTDADLQNLGEQAGGWLEENTTSLTSAGLSAVTGTMQFLTGFILALVVTFFFLRDGQRIWNFLVGMAPTAVRAPLAYAGDGAWRSLSGYIRATVLVAFIDAVGIGIGLVILKVPLALPLAALVFLGAFVPIVGAFVSGTVAVLVALVDEQAPGLLEGGGFVKALMVLGLVLLVQQIEGNILQPVIMSRAVSVHPLVVIIAVTAGILLAGIIGALVAVPVVAVLNTAVRRLNEYYRSRATPEPAEPGAAPAG